MQNQVDLYTYQVVFSEKEGQHEATCIEFPRLSHAAIDNKSALDGIKELVDFVIKQMQTRGQELPKPVEKRVTPRRAEVRRDKVRRIKAVSTDIPITIKREPRIRRIKTRRYHSRREADLSPRSSVDIEQVPSKYLVTGSNPVGGAKKPVVCYEWIESERGWGQRPDGISLHQDSSKAAEYIKEYWASMPKGETPDEYSRPEQRSTVLDVSEDVYDKVTKSKNGIRIWQTEIKKFLG